MFWCGNVLQASYYAVKNLNFKALLIENKSLVRIKNQS